MCAKRTFSGFGCRASRSNPRIQPVAFDNESMEQMREETPRKRTRLLEARSTMTPPTDETIPFLDVGETSKLGGMLFAVSECDFEMEEENLKIGVLDVQMTKVNLFPSDRVDLTDLNVALISKETGSREVVFWQSTLPDITKKNYLIGKRALVNIVEKLRSVRGTGVIKHRYLRKDLFPDDDSFFKFVQKTDRLLNTELPTMCEAIKAYSVIAKFSCKTYGQLILAMLIGSEELSFSKGTCGPPLRLMFLWLEGFVDTDQDAVRHRYLTLLYERVMTNTCDSCFERSLLFGENENIITYPYSYESFITREDRYMGVGPGRSLNYEFLKHDEPSRDSCLSWSFWEHNYLTPTYSKDCMIFQIKLEDGGYKPVPVLQHWGMSLIQCLHFLQKGLKRAVYGGGNSGLVSSVMEKSMHLNQCAPLKEMIVDLILLSRDCPELRILCRNVATFMILCVIPRDLVSMINPGTRGVDYYDTLVRYAVGSVSCITDNVMDLFHPNGGSAVIRQRLDLEDIQLTLIHYQG